MAEFEKKKKEISNEKIVDAAIECFGIYGYTNCSLMGVARRAGITAGLIVQRFVSKENLLFFVHRECVEKYFPQEDGAPTIRDRLLKALYCARKIQLENPNVFRFLFTFLDCADAPKDFKEKEKEYVKTRSLYKAIEYAQMQKILPYGDTFGLLQAYLLHIFAQLDVCERYSLKMPSDSTFLDFIQFRDIEEEKERNKKNAIITALKEIFVNTCTINLKENTARDLRIENKLQPFANLIDVRESISQSLPVNTSAAYLKQAKKYFNLDTLEDRLKGKSTLTFTFMDSQNRVVRHFFVPIAYDDEGRLVEVIAGLQVLFVVDNANIPCREIIRPD